MKNKKHKFVRTEHDIIGAAKIKDGFFIGDDVSALVRFSINKDLEFIVTNKILRIVNCAGMHVPNRWESIGIKYLTYTWQETECGLDESFAFIYKFVEDGLNLGEGVLICSFRGQNRSAAIVIAYLMRKFFWSFKKAFDFTKLKKNDIELKNPNRKSLLNFEGKLRRAAKVIISETWDINPEDNTDPEEILLTNTYLNSQPALAIGMPLRKFYGPLRKVKWSDLSTGDKKRLVSLEIPRYQDIHFDKLSKISEKQAKSIIKTHSDNTNADLSDKQNIYVLKRGESAKITRKENLKFILKDEKEYLEGKNIKNNSLNFYQNKKPLSEISLKKIKRPVSEYSKLINEKLQVEDENTFEDDNLKSERNFKIKSNNPQFKCLIYFKSDNTSNNFFVHAFQSPFTKDEALGNSINNSRTNETRQFSIKGIQHEARLKAAIDAKERIYGKKQGPENRKISSIPKNKVFKPARMNNFLKKSESSNYLQNSEIIRPQTAPQGPGFYSLKQSDPEDFEDKFLKINSLSKGKKQSHSNNSLVKVYYNR